ncbi:MAG: hypothetical protein HKM95_13540, partial [Inquilinus sp.]|nr:hypothetical protein [Inquilinus sp.]
MVNLLRAFAATFVAGTLVFVGWALPWGRWLGGETLAVLPDPQSSLVIMTSAWVGEILPLLVLLFKAVGVAFFLAALAHIIERLDAVGQRPARQERKSADSATPPKAGPTLLRHRLVTATALRIVAVVVFIVWVGGAAFPFLWWLQAVAGAGTLHDFYFVGGTMYLIAPALAGGTI